MKEELNKIATDSVQAVSEVVTAAAEEVQSVLPGQSSGGPARFKFLSTKPIVLMMILGAVGAAGWMRWKSRHSADERPQSDSDPAGSGPSDTPRRGPRGSMGDEQAPGAEPRHLRSA